MTAKIGWNKLKISLNKLEYCQLIQELQHE